MGVAAVADREKKPDAKGKYDANVKLRGEFKEQLEVVAGELDLYPGELIEQRIGTFIRTEYKRILKAKLKKAEEAGSE